MAVRLTAKQREAVRRDIAERGGSWDASNLAFQFARDRSKSDLEMFIASDYLEAIRAYREWLERNYRKVRAQSRAA